MLFIWGKKDSRRLDLRAVRYEREVTQASAEEQAKGTRCSQVDQQFRVGPQRLSYQGHKTMCLYSHCAPFRVDFTWSSLLIYSSPSFWKLDFKF